MIRKLAICSVLGALALTAPAQAATLTEVGDSARWSDSISNASAPHPAACTPLTCRSYELDLALHAGAWDEPGGLLVSLRWPEEQLDAGYDLDLYLYGPAGDVLAKSDSVIYAAAEGLWLQDPPNGRYRVVVAARDVVGTSPFEVIATAKRGWSVATTSLLLGGGDLTFPGTRPAEPEPLLPDLVPAEPGNFRIESTLAVNFYQATQRVPTHQPSCYPQETAGLTADEPGQGGNPLRCLRWDMVVENLGAGPFELRAYPGSATPATGYQAVYGSDGSYELRQVGGAYYSSAHGHVHFRGLDQVGLHTVAEDGSPGELVAVMPDKGICTIDLLNRSFGTAADGPSRYRFPSTCDAEDNADPNDPLYPGLQFFRMGLSAGWADIYPWFIPDQYIDITDVPDGRYLVVYRVNVSGAVTEATRHNNEAIACVEFHGTEASSCEAGP
ncbi:MAG TPA: lysyl oxidase family protein [Thermoleophilaceae bacterium]|nr:lysyl oxidase family protein [Thermoleophilaceae bacterium]